MTFDNPPDVSSSFSSCHHARVFSGFGLHKEVHLHKYHKLELSDVLCFLTSLLKMNLEENSCAERGYVFDFGCRFARSVQFILARPITSKIFSVLLLYDLRMHLMLRLIPFFFMQIGCPLKWAAEQFLNPIPAHILCAWLQVSGPDAQLVYKSGWL